MSWFDPVFNYCERGTDPSFWAEPVNAVTNAAFLAAAAAAGVKFSRLRQQGTPMLGSDAAVLGGLILLVAAIGTGSFLFHTFATRWALVADVAPITAFMLVYLVFALKRFLDFGWMAIGAAVPAFLLSGSLASSLTCAGREVVGAGGSTLTVAAGAPCLNGSLGYLPALISLWATAVLAKRTGVGAWKTLAVAAGVFSASLGFRTVDLGTCGTLFARGTHGAWHTLNALTLYLLLSAAIDRSSSRRVT